MTSNGVLTVAATRPEHVLCVCVCVHVCVCVGGCVCMYVCVFVCVNRLLNWCENTINYCISGNLRAENRSCDNYLC